MARRRFRYAIYLVPERPTRAHELREMLASDWQTINRTDKYDGHVTILRRRVERTARHYREVRRIGPPSWWGDAGRDQHHLLVALADAALSRCRQLLSAGEFDDAAVYGLYHSDFALMLAEQAVAGAEGETSEEFGAHLAARRAQAAEAVPEFREVS